MCDCQKNLGRARKREKKKERGVQFSLYLLVYSDYVKSRMHSNPIASVETDIMNDDQVFCLKFQDAPLISGSGHKL